MSSYSFQSSCSPGNDNSDDLFFDISDFLDFNDETQEEPPALLPTDPTYPHCRQGVAGDDADAGGGRIRLLNGHDQALARRGHADVERNTARSVGQRVVFRTKTEVETLDDGYKWRKYGKKKVKNSPNPRNYYRCSSVGCQVKKRVERAAEESSYLLTTYDGIHNHPAPSLTRMPPAYTRVNIMAAGE